MDLFPHSISNRALAFWSLIVAIEGLVVVYLIASEPSEAESIFAFGLSLQLLLIVSIVFLAVLFFVVVSIIHFYRLASWNAYLNARPVLVQYIFCGAFILEIAFLQIWFFLPYYYFPSLSGYLYRLRPLILWSVLLFAQIFIFLAYFRDWSLEGLKDWKGNTPTIIALVSALIVWGVIAVTKIGITPDNYFWNMAGVPILAGQIWIVVGITLAGLFLYRYVARFHIPSLVTFIGIWIVAALVWINTPLAPTFNAPGPYLPTKGFYPFVDAALFDLGAQSAIYGNGINFGSFIDRGLLMGFLAILHKLFGQNYLVIVGIQSAIFASFPALLYLLGKRLHSKAVGLMGAMLAILKISNAISGGKWLSTSHPKLLLTEFPTGIVLVLFSLYLVKWLERNNSRSYAFLGVGASIGIGILLRQNVFFMVPVFLFFGLFIVWKLHWKLALRNMLLFVAAFFLTISPWMWRNQRIANEPFFFLPQFNRVIEERYQLQGKIDQNQLVSIHLPKIVQIRARVADVEDDNILDQYQFIPKHFIHNIITSVLILPPSPVLDDLRHTVDKFPYWNRMENIDPGQLSGSMVVFIAINLVILSIGFAAAWKRVGFVSLVPLAVFLFYNLANSFARTSGGRYIVPVDWVIYFYYAIGLVVIIRFFINLMGFHTNDYFYEPLGYNQDDVGEKFSWSKASLTVLPFFLLVAALPILELALPGEKLPEENEVILQQLDESSFFEQTQFSRSQVEKFLSNPDALLLEGRGFYPRYYTYNEGEPILPGQVTPYTPREFPRLVFTLLLPDKDKPVLLPFDNSSLDFPDAAKVIVGGCQITQTQDSFMASYLNYINAAFVVVMDEPGAVYVRNPDAPLTCPLREPVCDNNHNCN